VLEYTSFVAMFPHLIAGPIVRFGDVAEQLRRPAVALGSRPAMMGLFFLGCGLTKKLLLADQLSPTVDRLYAQSGSLGLLASWVAALGYALQLYFDFSGYSDMAVGLAWLLGFHFPQNFDSPYKAVSITDFWNRWHMTLSRWLRDYVFFPMAHRFAVGGTSRTGRRELLGTYSCLIATMLLCGLWHGAAWTFVVWGGIHGTCLVAERASRDFRRRHGLRPPVPSAFRTVAHRALTFVIVVAAFVVFRSPNLGSAANMLGSMVGLNGVETLAQLHALVSAGFLGLVGALLVFVNVAPNTWQVEVVPRARYALALGTVTAVAIMSIAQLHTFIYFQF
jgi:alginate O-acetyltransferase complex protein AlgI